ncbi:hypothetical protein L228DRAFT_259726 [Xylona heveae TC161]|uniref:Uncharacterized protein n=1 Tax=Xylona heveae (strain CBS 132557 / TC161) TaxID=1328760 RepID=A0A165I825_XYLHT|nr:hypothetical protein L228DRAFT_259726 [Xylona heveae TC161]KZF24521.1 hypothetical protein L228DRAFT_259726 [Xylona heveae TC161]
MDQNLAVKRPRGRPRKSASATIAPAPKPARILPGPGLKQIRNRRASAPGGKRSTAVSQAQNGESEAAEDQIIVDVPKVLSLRTSYQNGIFSVYGLPVQHQPSPPKLSPVASELADPSINAEVKDQPAGSEAQRPELKAGDPENLIPEEIGRAPDAESVLQEQLHSFSSSFSHPNLGDGAPRNLGNSTEACLGSNNSHSTSMTDQPKQNKNFEDPDDTSDVDDLSDSDLPPPFSSRPATATLYTEPASQEQSESSEDRSEAHRLVAEQWDPITDPELFLAALENPEKRSTKALFAIAENAQRALKIWQDEWIILDKRTARFAQPPRKPADPRAVEAPVRFEDRKEADLYGYKYDPDPKKEGKQDPEKQRHGRVVGGRELRKLKASLAGKGLEGAGDPNAIVEGKRARRQRQAFDGLVTAGTRPRYAAEEGLKFSTEMVEESALPRKRGRPKKEPIPARVRAVREESLFPSTTSTEGEMEAETDRDTLASTAATPTPPPQPPIVKRRGRPPKGALAPQSEGVEKKRAAKASKRSRSMKKWWDARKAAALAKAKEAEAGDTNGTGGASDAPPSIHTSGLNLTAASSTETSVSPISQAAPLLQEESGQSSEISIVPSMKGRRPVAKPKSLLGRSTKLSSSSSSENSRTAAAPVTTGPEIRRSSSPRGLTEYEQYQKLSTPGQDSDLGKRKRKSTTNLNPTYELAVKKQKMAFEEGAGLGDLSRATSRGAESDVEGGETGVTSTEVDDDDGDEWDGD